MSPRHAAAAQRGDALVRVGAVLFGARACSACSPASCRSCSVARRPRSLATLAASLLPVGLGLALLGLLRGARSRRRER